MRNDYRRGLSLLALLTATTLAACKTSGLEGAASPGVQIPRDCEDLAADVADPGAPKGANAKVILGRTRVALAQARDNLGDTRECQARQRERFARGR